jgi:hypothetical protein
LPTPTGGSQSALDPCSQGTESLLSVTRIVRCGYAGLPRWVRVYGFRLHVAFNFMALLGLISGTVGVVGLVSGCTIMMRETRLAIQNLEQEQAELNAFAVETV